MFHFHIVLIMSICNMYVCQTSLKGDYGPYDVDWTDFKACSSIFDKRNYTNMSSTIKKEGDNYIMNMNVTFPTQFIIDEVKITVNSITKKNRDSSWNYKVVKPCEHYVIASILQQQLNAVNCVVKKTKSTIPSTSSTEAKSGFKFQDDTEIPPFDELTVKILSLRIPDGDSRYYAIKVTFFDQLILSGIVRPIGSREVIKERTIAKGSISYDPSDYEKMCLFADNPMIVNIQPLKSFESSPLPTDGQLNTPTIGVSPERHSNDKYSYYSKPMMDVNCCNVDILSMFIDTDKLCVKKRMQPMISPPTLFRKSWDNLPLLTMKLSVERHKDNAQHHKILKAANYMKLSLVGAYNMFMPYDPDFTYTAASKIPLYNEQNCNLVTFSQGKKPARKFKSTSFYPRWENLRLGDDIFTKADEKLAFAFKDIQNDSKINLEHYFNEMPADNKIIWGSFHRTLILGKTHRWFSKHIRRWNWPLEIHLFGEHGNFSMMAFLDLFKLLYPGVDTVHIAVPLYWLNSTTMMKNCGCETMMASAEKVQSTSQKHSKVTTDSGLTSTNTDPEYVRPTGADEASAFVIVSVKMMRPLVKLQLPPPIPQPEITKMLEEMEQCPDKRECTGRGQLDRDWQSTMRSAAAALRKVPHYGMTEFCMFNRQLSETRTRVELLTSCWLDGAVYVNNNFVVSDYLKSDEQFEELLLISHACLMKNACETLVGVDNQPLDPVLRAARHARQLQDTSHAIDLYLLLVAEKPYDANYWRELAICLKDVDRDWAAICMNESLMLDMRHPLTLLAKGCMVFEENMEAAEPFFMALLAMFPHWSTALIAANAYFLARDYFRLAEVIMDCLMMSVEGGFLEEKDFPRVWERELGDWWEPTPMLPGVSRYYDAADFLLRIRAMSLAEVCIGRAVSEIGESAAYFHLLALCCRLRNEVDDALCHLQTGIEKYGEISYLRSLEAECHHRNSNPGAVTAAFEKVGICTGAYSILLSLSSREPQRVRSMLVDLLRRHPSAYAWMSLADDWILRAAVGDGGDAGLTEEQTSAILCANACAVQALKCDRRAGRAWALLAQQVQPSARRLFCRNMAAACGYMFDDERKESKSSSQQSICYRLGVTLRECRCQLCTKLTL